MVMEQAVWSAERVQAVSDLHEEFGRRYFETLLKFQDELDADEIPVSVTTFNARTQEGPSGTVLVLTTLLDEMSMEEAREFANRMMESIRDNT